MEGDISSANVFELHSDILSEQQQTAAEAAAELGTCIPSGFESRDNSSLTDSTSNQGITILYSEENESYGQPSDVLDSSILRMDTSLGLAPGAAADNGEQVGLHTGHSELGQSSGGTVAPGINAVGSNLDELSSSIGSFADGRLIMSDGGDQTAISSGDAQSILTDDVLNSLIGNQMDMSVKNGTQVVDSSASSLELNNLLEQPVSQPEMKRNQDVSKSSNGLRARDGFDDSYHHDESDYGAVRDEFDGASQTSVRHYDDDFAWEEYLEVSKTEPVKNEAFQHISDVFQGKYKIGMNVEVPHCDDNNSFWLATIQKISGPLLKLVYFGANETMEEFCFWRDASRSEVHPAGWCKSQELPLTPPKSLISFLPENWVSALPEVINDNCEADVLATQTEQGVPAYQKIAIGMKLEVQDEFEPYNFWIATVIDNVGGRLMLRYDTPDSSAPDFWLFYTSKRLYPFQWTAEYDQCQYSPPSSILTDHGLPEWEAVMEMAKEDNRRMPLAPEYLTGYVPTETHEFQEGMKLEAINPLNRSEICPATVMRVINEFWFLVQIDGTEIPPESMGPNDRLCAWLCEKNHPYIFPIGWAKSNDLKLSIPPNWKAPSGSDSDFDWNDYLDVVNAKLAPVELFAAKTSADELGFHPGLRMESVNLENNSELFVSRIVSTKDNLIWVKNDNGVASDSLPSPSPVIYSTDSTDLFPAGWCQHHNGKIVGPKYDHPGRERKIQERQQKELIEMLRREENAHLEKMVNDELSGSDNQDTMEKENTIPDVHPASSDGIPPTVPSLPKSQWCSEKIYFNQGCVFGPYLNPGRIDQLPKSVGPGPVVLVIREVFALLLGASVKSSGILKSLQIEEKPPAGFRLELLRAKCKGVSYKAYIAVATTADLVPVFCKDTCKRLQSCPYFFGLEQFNGPCPDRCTEKLRNRITKKRAGLGNEDSDADGIDEDTSEGGVSLSKRALLSTSSPLSRMAERLSETIEKNRRTSLLNNMNRGTKTSLTNSLKTSAKTSDSTATKTAIPKKVMDSIWKSRSPYIPTALPTVSMDPAEWSIEQVASFLDGTSSKDLVKMVKKEEIDGAAFLLLNLPTVRDQLGLQMGPAVRLCQQIERLKLISAIQFHDSRIPI